MDNLKICNAKIRKSYQKKSVNNPLKDYYFILRDTANIESLIVEYGFIDTEEDRNKLLNDYKCYAHAVVDAILSYKGISVENNFYIVKKGDTLYSIAKKYNTTVEKLKDINNLKSNVISINQKLLINSNYYIVKKGDTLYSIAKKYNTTVEKLKDINNLKSNVISINQKLIIH